MNGINVLSALPDQGRAVSVAGGPPHRAFFTTYVGRSRRLDRVVSRMRGARPLFVALPYAVAAPFDRHAHVATIGARQSPTASRPCAAAEPNIYGTIIDGTPANERGSAQGFLLMAFAGSPPRAGASATSRVVGSAAPRARRLRRPRRADGGLLVFSLRASTSTRAPRDTRPQGLGRRLHNRASRRVDRHADAHRTSGTGTARSARWGGRTWTRAGARELECSRAASGTTG